MTSDVTTYYKLLLPRVNNYKEVSISHYYFLIIIIKYLIENQTFSIFLSINKLLLYTLHLN